MAKSESRSESAPVDQEKKGWNPLRFLRKKRSGFGRNYLSRENIDNAVKGTYRLLADKASSVYGRLMDLEKSKVYSMYNGMKGKVKERIEYDQLMQRNAELEDENQGLRVKLDSYSTIPLDEALASIKDQYEIEEEHMNSLGSIFNEKELLISDLEEQLEQLEERAASLEKKNSDYETMNATLLDTLRSSERKGYGSKDDNLIELSDLEETDHGPILDQDDEVSPVDLSKLERSDEGSIVELDDLASPLELSDLEKHYPEITSLPKAADDYAATQKKDKARVSSKKRGRTEEPGAKRTPVRESEKPYELSFLEGLCGSDDKETPLGRAIAEGHKVYDLGTLEKIHPAKEIKRTPVRESEKPYELSFLEDLCGYDDKETPLGRAIAEGHSVYDLDTLSKGKDEPCYDLKTLEKSFPDRAKENAFLRTRGSKDDDLDLLERQMMKPADRQYPQKLLGAHMKYFDDPKVSDYSRLAFCPILLDIEGGREALEERGYKLAVNA